jgi:hypothetical protein
MVVTASPQANPRADPLASLPFRYMKPGQP